jgi:hypothetical protein
MNVHQVATPEMILEEAKSYIIFFREPAGLVSAYIALYLTVTNRRLYYVHSLNPFPERDMGMIEQEALEFAEGLGAMLDEKDFTRMSMEERKSWVDAQEIFSPKAESAPSPEPSPAAAPSPTPAQEAAPPVVSPPPAQPVTAAPKEPAPAAPPAQTAPVQQEQPVQQVPAQPVPQAQPAPRPHPREDAEHVSPPEPADLHEQKTQNRKAAAASRHAAPSAEAARKRQEIMQKAIKEGIAKPPKQPPSSSPAPSAGVVSRDREALARLLTSF